MLKRPCDRVRSAPHGVGDRERGQRPCRAALPAGDPRIRAALLGAALAGLITLLTASCATAPPTLTEASPPQVPVEPASPAGAEPTPEARADMSPAQIEADERTRPAPPSRAMDLLSLLNAAVLDWCDTQAGVFRLPHISAPSCEKGEVLYLGTLKGIFGEADAPDAAWWWKQRTDLPSDLVVGVLWYVGPNDPKELCAASQGMLCQCPTALAALNNPARVPVVLIGPGAAVCEADR